MLSDFRGPRRLVEHLRTSLYHPRSDAHSNAVCLGILDDLLEHCPPLAMRAREGRVVAKVNHTVTVNHQAWNIDLALGPPPGSPHPPEESPIRFAPPAVVEIAVEAKGVMTEHGKARRNRLRDFHAFHSHAHTYDRNVVAVGVVIVNMAEFFWSPTRREEDLTRHRNPAELAESTIDVFRSLPFRDRPNDGAGLEAFAALVVRHDNMLKNMNLPAGAPASSPTEFVAGAPAPQVGDPLHYATMIHRVCRAYRARWVD